VFSQRLTRLDIAAPCSSCADPAGRARADQPDACRRPGRAMRGTPRVRGRPPLRRPGVRPAPRPFIYLVWLGSLGCLIRHVWSALCVRPVPSSSCPPSCRSRHGTQVVTVSEKMIAIAVLRCPSSARRRDPSSARTPRTRRVRLVRGQRHGASTQYRRAGGGGGRAVRCRARGAGSSSTRRP